MSDFAVRISIRNARILRAMKAAGYPTAVALARAAGLDPNRISSIMRFKEKPIAYGDWAEWAMAISSALHVEPEELWPEHMRYLKASKAHIEVEMDTDEVQQLTHEAEYPVNKAKLQQLLSMLPPKQQFVLESRFGLNSNEMTFEEVGKHFGCSRERIRQIEIKAIRNLRTAIRQKRIDPRVT